MLLLADKFSCDLQGGILFKCQANLFTTEPFASPVSPLQGTLRGALHWHCISDLLPSEQHWYTATSSTMQPMNYIIVSISFQLILLSVFIVYLLCYTLAVDSGYSPFSDSYFDTPRPNCRSVNRRVLLVIWV